MVLEEKYNVSHQLLMIIIGFLLFGSEKKMRELQWNPLLRARVCLSNLSLLFVFFY
jgi:hypothetical protein